MPYKLMLTYSCEYDIHCVCKYIKFKILTSKEHRREIYF
jgi:hypothetical protein